MLERISATLFTAVLCTGCMGTVRIPVLESAALNVPKHIETIAVVDRSAPRNAGEGVLKFLEAAISGEGILEDRDGAAAAVSAVADVLADSPRFEVVVPNVDRREISRGPLGGMADWQLIEDICQTAGCDAVISLEFFDSDSDLMDDETEVHADKSQTFHVNTETRVRIVWRLYDAKERSLVDEVLDHRGSENWDGEGPTRDDAIANLPETRDAVLAVGRSLGQAYGRRVAPSWRWVGREYYKSGDPALKEAKVAVEANDWDRAESIWAQLAESTPDPEVRGKANFNIALACEVRGELGRALAMARMAHADLDSGTSQDYVYVLERRLADRDRLDQQLQPSAPSDEGTPEGVTSPL